METARIYKLQCSGVFRASGSLGFDFPGRESPMCGPARRLGFVPARCEQLWEPPERDAEHATSCDGGVKHSGGGLLRKSIRGCLLEAAPLSHLCVFFSFCLSGSFNGNPAFRGFPSPRDRHIGCFEG